MFETVTLNTFQIQSFKSYLYLWNCVLISLPSTWQEISSSQESELRFKVLSLCFALKPV